MGKAGSWKRIDTDWRDVVLVCRKCSKKLRGGFGPDGEQSLAKLLRKSLAAEEPGGKRKIRRCRIAVVEIGCLGLCPKGAVVTARGQDPGGWVLVPKGAEAVQVLEHLALRPAADVPES